MSSLRFKRLFCGTALVLLGLTNVSIFAQPFQFVRATEQISSGGAAGMGSYHFYTITVVAKKPSTMLHFDRLWVGTAFVKPEAVKKALLNPTAAFAVNDTVIISGSYQQAGSRNVDGKIVPEQSAKPQGLKVPYKYKGAALLGYTLKKKRKYKEIKSLYKEAPFQFE